MHNKKSLSKNSFWEKPNIIGLLIVGLLALLILGAGAVIPKSYYAHTTLLHKDTKQASEQLEPAKLEAIQIGDRISGMEITAINRDVPYTSTQKATEIVFSGKKTLHGTFKYPKAGTDDGFIDLSSQVQFQTDTDQLPLLPLTDIYGHTGARGTIWLPENDPAINLFGSPGTQGEATITIDQYRITYPSVESPGARVHVVKVSDLKVYPQDSL